MARRIGETLCEMDLATSMLLGGVLLQGFGLGIACLGARCSRLDLFISLLTTIAVIVLRRRLANGARSDR